MSERARNLAHQLEQANQALIATIEGLSDAQWKATTPGDGRSVGVVAHHVASSHKAVAGLVGAIAHGQKVPTITMEMIHEGNAAHARQFAQLPELLATGKYPRFAAAMAEGGQPETLDLGAHFDRLLDKLLDGLVP